MTVLVTGSSGFLGREVTRRLAESGDTVIPYDLRDGLDILDIDALTRRMAGSHVVVHLAAIENESRYETSRASVVGTQHVLLAMGLHGIRKLIYMSSVDSLGIFQGEGVPRYLPLDDEYPCHPVAPYSVAKKLCEELCLGFSTACDLDVLCLRAPGIWDENTYHTIVGRRKAKPEYEWSPYWEYGAFIDIRDLSAAIVKACACEISGYHCCAIAAEDITTSGRTSRELAEMLFPAVEWRGGIEYDRAPYRSLMDSGNARDLLGWRPEYSWNRFIEENGG